ncbi:unnamed protein product [Bemisia tabaci]|uniref:Malonyl-CoA decarboxylase n=1 Tax=Bemisia tabaci TaxID=7038 RepID=A0A9P0A5F1_BEMTA|nr:unnamed protein product [Bemisia tabaci]
MNCSSKVFFKGLLPKYYVNIFRGSVSLTSKLDLKHSVQTHSFRVFCDDNKFFDNQSKYSTHSRNLFSSSKSLSVFGSKMSAEQLFNCVESILASQDKHVSATQEVAVKSFFSHYTVLDQEEKFKFLRKLACDFDVNHEAVTKHILNTKTQSMDQNDLTVIENKLRTLLTPSYLLLFKTVGRFQNGVKFLVDLRENILQLQSKLTAMAPESSPVKQMNLTLKNLISDWFSVGFLELQRITWKSSCQMLQKISEYEAVHPMRSWTDLKRRVGPYRRCFVYTHFAMPDEPLVVLHTALCKNIVSSTSEIFSSSSNSKQLIDSRDEPADEENMENINTAIFYSISSTQPGLQGIELGNHLIKRVVREVQSELPQISQFSTISPIPGFTLWLMDRFKQWESGATFNQFPVDEIKKFLGQDDESFWRRLRQLFASNAWYKEPALREILEEPLMKLCAHYLFNEKKRSYALNSVANFHLRNGAVMWRINWLADVSPRGLSNSCGIMVNYRYFLPEVEANSDNYLKNQVIAASESVQKLASDRLLTAKL